MLSQAGGVLSNQAIRKPLTRAARIKIEKETPAGFPQNRKSTLQATRKETNQMRCGNRGIGPPFRRKYEK
jgi:hypothetical protein